MDRFGIQDMQYQFPYHYIPFFQNGRISRKRELAWGVEYLSYLKFVEKKIREKNYESILDVGCGDGRFLSMLYETGGFSKLKGIDLSARAIQLAQALNDGVEYEIKDIKEETEKYKAVTIIEVLEHLPEADMSDFFSGIYNVLDEDGRVFITVPSVNVPLNKKHYRHYTIDLLKKHLRQSNSGLVVEEGCFIVPLPTKWEKVVRKLMNNRLYELKGFDRWCYKRLWRNGLVASKTKGGHVFAVLKKEI